MNFASTWNKLFNHRISSEFLLTEGYVQCALRKELCIALKQLLWEGLTDEFCQCLQQFT